MAHGVDRRTYLSGGRSLQGGAMPTISTGQRNRVSSRSIGASRSRDGKATTIRRGSSRCAIAEVETARPGSIPGCLRTFYSWPSSPCWGCRSPFWWRSVRLCLVNRRHGGPTRCLRTRPTPASGRALAWRQITATSVFGFHRETAGTKTAHTDYGVGCGPSESCEGENLVVLRPDARTPRRPDKTFAPRDVRT